MKARGSFGLRTVDLRWLWVMLRLLYIVNLGTEVDVFIRVLDTETAANEEIAIGAGV
ncbi:hypothetical protein HanIR_Chr06g0266651 [Helianthus annuus]|nr:hypothetical protein HanIR_Chr06g0266651 [Helianthus annuus]